MPRRQDIVQGSVNGGVAFRMRQTVLERAISTISPHWALSRTMARLKLEAIRAYDGAQKNRRTQGWRTSENGPVAEVRAGRVLLRQRSRDLARNNAWATRALAIKVANQIGTGIRPRAATPDVDLNRQIDRVHEEWAAECAPESGGDLYGMQALAAMGRAESGESLILLDRSGGIRPGGVPLTLQVLEPDWLADDSPLTRESADGWVDGVRFDQQGRRTAYRLWTGNPNEAGVSLRRESRIVPAEDMIHLFRRTRPGQVRGVPDLAPVIMRLRDLDDYHDAALMLAKVQAVLGAFVTQNGGPAASQLGRDTEDADGNKVEELAPGIVAYLNPGEDVKFLSPQGGGPFEPYTRIMLHMIAAGVGVTYHQQTGDLSESNYTSHRAGSLEFRRLTEQDQHLMLIPSLCRPVWTAFVSQAVLSGRLPIKAANAPATYTPPRFELVDPMKDTEAVKSQIRAGLMTWTEAVSEMGYDPETQVAEIQRINAMLSKAGIVLDIDPRLVTANGQAVDPGTPAQPNN